MSREKTATLLRERLLEADRGIEVPAGLWDRVRRVPVAERVRVRRRSARSRLAVAAAGVFVAVAASAVSVGAWWLVRSPAPAPEPPAAPVGVTLRIHNAERPCRPLRTLECGLRLAHDPYAVYARHDNTAGMVWHGDRVIAECVIIDGTLITDESGISSRRWYRVTSAENLSGWLPGVRTRNSTEVRPCLADGADHRPEVSHDSPEPGVPTER